VRWLNLSGGEPFLRDDVPEVVEAALAALPRLAVVTVPTTGQRTEDILRAAERIASTRLKRFYVTVSIEGPPELHDELRGRPGAFDRAVATWQGLRALAGVRPYFGVTLSDRNVDRVEHIRAALAERVPALTWSDLHFNVYTESSHYYDNLGAPAGLARPRALPRALDEARRERERSLDPGDRLEAAYLRLLPRFLRTGRSPVPCRSLQVSLFVAANGDVYPCTVYSRRLGNLRETPLPDILRGEEARAARAVIRRDACPGCWSPCEAHPTLLANAPGSFLRR
jgi:MoaA/NifB/PqqE/SkfB family radical SAM enzyme